VRNDGWMGTSLTYDAPRTFDRAKPLKLRYGCYMHAGAPVTADLDRHWRLFADLPVPSLEPPQRANP
jgi:hypothetical protein